MNKQRKQSSKSKIINCRITLCPLWMQLFTAAFSNFSQLDQVNQNYTVILASTECSKHTNPGIRGRLNVRASGSFLSFTLAVVIKIRATFSAFLRFRVKPALTITCWRAGNSTKFAVGGIDAKMFVLHFFYFFHVSYIL